MCTKLTINDMYMECILCKNVRVLVLLWHSFLIAIDISNDSIYWCYDDLILTLIVTVKNDEGSI